MPDWIKHHKNNVAEIEILNETSILDGEYKYVAFYTNREVAGGTYENGVFAPGVADVPHLLELRIFNCEREFKAVRTQTGKTFTWRIADETRVCKEFYTYETQLLDIDSKKECPENPDGTTTFTAMGGGKYNIPAKPDCDSVEIVNYIKYDEYGNMQFVDFRLKRFFRGGKKPDELCQCV